MNDELTPAPAEPTPEPVMTYTSGPFQGLNGEVVRLGTVSFFADVSSEMLYPLIPIFLATVLNLANPAAVLGIIEGAAEATASLLRTVSGRWSDLSGRRKPFVFFGYALAALAKPLIGFANTWPLVLVARVMDRFGKGLRTSPRDALLGDLVDPAYRGKAFGWHRAMDTAGAVLGPFIALAMITFWPGPGTLRLAFQLAFIPGIIGALIVLSVREHRAPPKAGVAPSIRLSALPPAFRAYLLAWGAFAVANSSDTFLLLRATKVTQGAGVLNTAALVILFYIAYNIIYMVASPWLGHLSDKLNRKSVLIGGLCVFALVYLGFALVSQAWMFWPLFAVYGLYIAATDGVGKALAVDLVPKEIRASALGLLGTVTGLALLAANVVAGALWTALGPWAAFSYGALGALAGALLLSRLPAKQPELS